MNYKKLGHTDILVSPVALGCWGFVQDFHWGAQENAQSIATVYAALDAGINFFDTAEAYGDGRSEEVLGRALAGRRHQAVVASKVNGENLAPADLRRSCEASLRRLGTDYLDLYQIHWPNLAIPLAETMGELQELQAEGKIRAIGVSNFAVAGMQEVLPLGSIGSNQLPYNLLWRAIEFDIQPICQQRGVGILCYSPLMHALLADKYPTLADMPDSRARSRHFSGQRAQTRHGEAGCEAETMAALARIREICQEIGEPMAHVAIAWLMQRPAVTAVIAGARRPEQAVDNAEAARLVLSPDVVQALDDATEEVKQCLGPNPDMWQSQSRFY
ncbi:MAG: aldo/keto reductase [Chloroflexota bacterium]|nr:aldo/keto reductase [Chloroflexota bacterium]